VIAELAKGYALAEFYPLTHPTLAQALHRLESDLLALGRELRFDAAPGGLSQGVDGVARRLPHASRFAARLAEHGVHAVALRPDVGADALGRFLSGTTLPARVARAAGGLREALSAAGVSGVALNGSWVMPAHVPAGTGAGVAAAAPTGVELGITVWSAQDIYDQVRASAQRVESESVDELRRMLREGTDSQRLEVLQRLELVAQWTVDHGETDRAVALLGELRGDAEHLAGRSPAVRGHVMLAIHRLASRTLVEELVARLGRARTEEERTALRSTLLHVGIDTVTPLVRALTAASDLSARRAYRDALVALDHVGVPLLEEMTGDDRWFVVRNMVGILGEIRSPDAIEHFTRTIHHGDARVRRETIVALPKIGGDDAVALLVRGLDDTEAGLRAAAALGLGLVKGPGGVAPLLARLARETDSEVLLEIVRALGRIADVRAVPALAERATAGGWLSRTPVVLRVEAVRALAEIGGDDARAVLQRLLRDRSAEVREAALKAVGLG
jgi:HEAT repeat protein